MQDFDTVLITDLPTDIPRPQAHVTEKNFVTVLGRPHNMVPVIVDAVGRGRILHNHVLSKISLTLAGGSFLKGHGYNTIRSR